MNGFRSTDNTLREWILHGIEINSFSNKTIFVYSIKFSPDGNLCDFLTRFSMEGGSHHQALAYGRLAGTIEKIGTLMGIECSVVNGL